MASPAVAVPSIVLPDFQPTTSPIQSNSSSEREFRSSPLRPKEGLSPSPPVARSPLAGGFRGSRRLRPRGSPRSTPRRRHRVATPGVVMPPRLRSFKEQQDSMKRLSRYGLLGSVLRIVCCVSCRSILSSSRLRMSCFFVANFSKRSLRGAALEASITGESKKSEASEAEPAPYSPFGSMYSIELANVPAPDHYKAEKVKLQLLPRYPSFSIGKQKRTPVVQVRCGAFSLRSWCPPWLTRKFRCFSPPNTTHPRTATARTRYVGGPL